MMIVPLIFCALALTPASYQFTDKSKTDFDLQVTFDGFVPLFGGQEGKVEVVLGMRVDGLAADQEGNLQASSTINSSKLLLNGEKFPLPIEDVQEYFPKTTISLTAQGKILKTDAPDLALPIKLPGLDIKRFPDISYVAIQFPTEGLELGKNWTYQKMFGESEVSYCCKATQISDESIDLDVELSQYYETFEDESLTVVKDEKDAVARVRTTVKGSGKATFDRKLGVIRKYNMCADVESISTNFDTMQPTTRKLKTIIDVRLKKRV